jgi:hypothetical protein
MKRIVAFISQTTLLVCLCMKKEDTAMLELFSSNSILFADLMNSLPCEISSSHGGEYEVQNFLLGCTTV